MSLPKKIAVLFYENLKPGAKPMGNTFVVHEVMAAFQSMGINVEIISGTRRIVEADILFMHVDLSVIPDEYLRYAEHFPYVINGIPRDITKRNISKNILDMNDDYDGPVIVKSNLNCGGYQELWAGFIEKPVVGNMSNLTLLPPGSYMVFRHMADAPMGAYVNPALVVEKFLPEFDGELYGIRSYTFGGARGWCNLRKGTDQLVKANSVVERTVVDVHPDILREQQRLGFDFGKFDYVVRDGQAILLDANLTPTYPDDRPSAMKTARAQDYANGLLDDWRHRTGIKTNQATSNSTTQETD